MLVLSRKLGETLVIGENVIVKVIHVQGNSVRLGIEAPRSVPVHRAEIHQRLEPAPCRGLAVAPALGADPCVA